MTKRPMPKTSPASRSRRRVRGSRAMAAFAALTAALALAAPASAEQTAVSKYTSSTNFDAFRGDHLIRTNPATVNGIGYVHALQLDIGAPGENFVAIGTAKGVGVDNCPNSYDSPWDIYTDGAIAGAYFCHTEANNLYTAGDSAGFTITWANCPGTSNPRWVMYMDGFRRCISAGTSQGSRTIAMLETTGGSNVDRNIDFTAYNMEYKISGTWVGMNGLSQSVANNYSITIPQPDRANIFLAPLD